MLISIAPVTWGGASKHGREEYYREMDQGFDVLRYYDNHWKPHAIVTSSCSQWYHDHDKKCIRQ